MSNQRIDTVDRHFVPVKKLERYIKRIFWINIFLSFALLFLEGYPTVETWVSIVFIVGTVFYGGLSLVLGVWVLPAAESHRSTNLIADSLGVTLNYENTNLYYNNNQKPSIIRLGMSVFENSLFSWTVTSKMLKIERCKVFCWFFLLIVLSLIRDTPLDVISFVAQAIFSTSLLNDYLRLENARFQFHRIHKEFWNLFLKGIPANNRTTQSIILNLTNRYEATKTSLTTSLNSEIFKEINDEKIQEWEDIKKRLNIS